MLTGLGRPVHSRPGRPCGLIADLALLFSATTWIRPPRLLRLGGRKKFNASRLPVEPRRPDGLGVAPRTLQLGAMEVRLLEPGIPQVRLLQLGASEVRLLQLGTPQVRLL
jgi:hypothetical protein